MRVVPVAMAWTIAGAAVAAEPPDGPEFNYAVSAGATRSDNAGRTPTDQGAETSLDAGLNAGLEHERGRLSAQLAADLRYTTHSHGNYEDQLNGGVAAALSWRLTPWMSWSVQDNFGQSLIEARDAVRPDNTQNTNAFSTGPDLRLSLGPRTSVTMQGRWSDLSYEVSDAGSRGLSGTLGLLRRVTDRADVSVNASTEHTEAKGTVVNGDYDIHAVYLGWNVSGARTTIGLRAGGNRLEDDIGSTDSALFGFDFIRRVSARSTLAIHGGRSFGTPADLLQRDQGIRPVAADDRPGVASSGALRADHATVSWRTEAVRSSIGLSADWRRERQRNDTALDRKSVGGSLDLSRQLAPRLDVLLSANYLTEDFQASSVEADEWSTSLGFNWSLTRQVAISTDWTRAVGQGDTTLGADTRDYTENRYSLRLTWSPVQ